MVILFLDEHQLIIGYYMEYKFEKKWDIIKHKKKSIIKLIIQKFWIIYIGPETNIPNP